MLTPAFLVFGTMKLLSILCKAEMLQKEEGALEPRDSGIRIELFSGKGPTTIIQSNYVLTGDVNVSPQDTFKYARPHLHEYSVSCRMKRRVFLWHHFEKRLCFLKGMKDPCS